MMTHSTMELFYCACGYPPDVAYHRATLYMRLQAQWTDIQRKSQQMTEEDEIKMQLQEKVNGNQ